MNPQGDPDGPLRIAYLTYRGKPHVGGQGVYTRHLTKALVDLGHHVEVFGGQPYPVLDDRIQMHKLPSLDTFNDQRHAYMFSVYPLGIQWDALFTEGQGADPNFDALFESHGMVTSEGYVTMLAIPFKSLRFSPDEKQEWGIVFGRNIPRLNEQSFWPQYSSRIEGPASLLSRRKASGPLASSAPSAIFHWPTLTFQAGSSWGFSKWSSKISSAWGGKAPGPAV